MTTEAAPPAPHPAPAPAAPPAQPHTKKETLVDALKKGKDWAALLVLLLSFGQSIYAAYFKPEKDAHTAYETSKRGLEDFSERVDFSVGELKGRLDVVEKLCIEKHGVPLAVAEPVEPVAHRPVVISLDPTIVRRHVGDIAGTNVFNTAGGDPDGLHIDLPDAPWEKQQVE